MKPSTKAPSKKSKPKSKSDVSKAKTIQDFERLVEDHIKASFEQYRNNIEEHKASIHKMLDQYSKNKISSADLDKSVSIQPVYMTRDMNNILDFVNSCSDEVKDKVLKALKTTKKTDKALFLTSVNEGETLYVILMTLNTMPEEEGLALVYSPDLDSIAFFLSELTDLTVDAVKNQFK